MKITDTFNAKIQTILRDYAIEDYLGSDAVAEATGEIISAVRELVKSKKKVCGGDLQMNDEYEQCHGYNQALDDLLKQLKEGEE